METDKLSDSVHLMISVLRAHRSMCEQLLCELEIHHSQHRMLMNLSRRKEAPSQKELAGDFRVSPAAIAVTIRKLENGGYITRSTYDGDMRQNRIEITERGREVIEKSHSIFSSVDARMFDGFSDGDIDCFHSYLERIQNNLTGEER